ncbi:cyclin N-terminal domain-containing protein 1 [Trichomycterus rosablanca]|uniref:cyclin N-terminal domain-containing protein 1 n=1 Tax=Trichomycterus rosablanca TaxID=2290929 RepID=UPI002F35362B
MNNVLFKSTASKTLIQSSPNQEKNIRFGETSFEMLSDFLTDLNNLNKSNLENVSSVCFKDRIVVEHTFLICKEFGLDPSVCFHAVEILERFMVKHIRNLFSCSMSEVCDGATFGNKASHEELVFKSLRGKLYTFIVSSVQIASKLAYHSNVIDNSSASRYLQSLGCSCHKDKLLESELIILKTLGFKVNVLNPLSYVETFLEVLGHNDPAIPVAQLHHLCKYVLQFIYLQKKTIYRSLLTTVTGCLSPSPNQRVKFVSVSEDCMLLGVGVIAVAAFIYQTSTWEKVVEELTLITGISTKSIMDFALVTVTYIANN